MTGVAGQIESPSEQPRKNPDQSVPWIFPAILIVSTMWLAHVASSIGDWAMHFFFYGKIIGPAICTLLLLGWWFAVNRGRTPPAIRDILVILLIAIGTTLIANTSITVMGLILYGLPTICTAWAAWLLVSAGLNWPARRLGVLAVWCVVGLAFSILRIDGMDGKFNAKFSLRWTPTPESKLLSELSSTPKQTLPADINPSAELELQEGDWPGFRGPDRDGRVAGIRIDADWNQSPPRELWRRRIGPGWSSCTVIGNHLFTQEQRGDEEMVVCYHTETGGEIWKHADRTRFEEVVAGAGPRGTPTFHEGRLYSLGANGTLNCLNADTGERIWQADILKDAKVEKPPQWGFASSPLVARKYVSVFAGGADGRGVVAYDINDGRFAWSGCHGKRSGEGLNSYSSTTAVTVRGHKEILIATNIGLTSMTPDVGSTLWEYRWPVDQARVVQPIALNSSEFLLGTGPTGGIRRIQIYYEREIWRAHELWTSKHLKPYFNDFVVHQNEIYGFDSSTSGSIFTCISLEDGSLRWRTRGYGSGQVLLIADDDRLLVTTETGDVALVAASPDGHHELGRFKAMEGKTWNHPVLAHGKLFVRNSEEIACFEVPMITVSGTEKKGDTKAKETAVQHSVDERSE